MVYMSLETFNMNCICVYHSPLKTIAHWYDTKKWSHMNISQGSVDYQKQGQ
jgi:hypothetical protein